jgi:hypothetical protein
VSITIAVAIPSFVSQVGLNARWRILAPVFVELLLLAASELVPGIGVVLALAKLAQVGGAVAPEGAVGSPGVGAG